MTSRSQLRRLHSVSPAKLTSPSELSSALSVPAAGGRRPPPLFASLPVAGHALHQRHRALLAPRTSSAGLACPCARATANVDGESPLISDPFADAVEAPPLASRRVSACGRGVGPRVTATSLDVDWPSVWLWTCRPFAFAQRDLRRKRVWRKKCFTFPGFRWLRGLVAMPRIRLAKHIISIILHRNQQ